MNLIQAQTLGAEILKLISPHCIEAHVAGSTRRLKSEDIKDVEIVAVPITNDFEHMRALREIVNKRWGAPKDGAFPSKYTKVRSVANIDFFWCDARCFGLNLFIRTGPVDFVTRALGHWKAITNGGYSLEAQLHLPDGEVHPTPTEQSVFDALKCKFLAPEKRK